RAPRPVLLYWDGYLHPLRRIAGRALPTRLCRRLLRTSAATVPAGFSWGEHALTRESRKADDRIIFRRQRHREQLCRRSAPVLRRAVHGPPHSSLRRELHCNERDGRVLSA